MLRVPSHTQRLLCGSGSNKLSEPRRPQPAFMWALALLPQLGCSLQSVCVCVCACQVLCCGRTLIGAFVRLHFEMLCSWSFGRNSFSLSLYLCFNASFSQAQQNFLFVRYYRAKNYENAWLINEESLECNLRAASTLPPHAELVVTSA